MDNKNKQMKDFTITHQIKEMWVDIEQNGYFIIKSTTNGSRIFVPKDHIIIICGTPAKPKEIEFTLYTICKVITWTVEI